MVDSGNKVSKIPQYFASAFLLSTIFFQYPKKKKKVKWYLLKAEQDFLDSTVVKNPAASAGTWVQSLVQEDLW